MTWALAASVEEANTLRAAGMRRAPSTRRIVMVTISSGRVKPEWPQRLPERLGSGFSTILVSYWMMMLRLTGAAAFQFAFPAWEAVTVTVPVPLMIALDP